MFTTFSMRHDSKDTEDLESTYPFINGKEEGLSVGHEKKNYSEHFDPHWTMFPDDFILWRSLFFGLLSLNILLGIILIFYLNQMQQTVLTSQGLIPKSR
jgi:hypothetical protein